MSVKPFDTRYFERYARLSLVWAGGAEFSALRCADLPDLQAPDRTLGVEVTRAMLQSRQEARTFSDEIAGRLNRAADAGDAGETGAAKAALLAGGSMLGILVSTPEAWRRWAPGINPGLNDEEIEGLVVARTRARQQKNYAEADRLRKILAEEAIVLEDSPSGTRWRRG